MELNGALSNPADYRRGLDAMIETRRRLVSVGLAPTQLSGRTAKPRVGEVLETVKHVLREAGKPLRVSEIHAACERVLGRPVVYSTVKDCLREKRRMTPLFMKVRHGVYELIADPRSRGLVHRL